jgi:hypothetical protein
MISGVVEMAQDPIRSYRARHAQQDEEGTGHTPAESDNDAATLVDPPTEPEIVPEPVTAAVSEVADEWGGPDEFRFAVRPYSWTGGRTRPVQELAVETLVSTSDEGRNVAAICSAEHAAIAELCGEIRSVAEVAAHLSLPLGVVRVLLADMIDTGLVHVHRNPMGWGNLPDLSLMERVLEGLYRL